jgi:sulfite reductase (NADPH) flavoprotein alpha-component
MVVLTVSGSVLIARRQGGWRKWFAPMRGPVAGRWHGEIARIAMVTLALSALTALWMTASTFDLLPADEANAAFTTAVSGQTGLSPADMPALTAVPVSELRELTFPYAGDATDAFTLTTAQGAGFIDQGTGAVLVWATNGPWTRFGEWIYFLHTGEGAAVWGLLLGLFTLAAPVLAVTGTLVWLRNRRNVPAWRAWSRRPEPSRGKRRWQHMGLCKALGQACQQTGGSVHLAPLSPRPTGRPSHPDYGGHMGDGRCASRIPHRTRADRRSGPPSHGRACCLGLWRPQLSGVLWLCRRH